MASSMKVAAVLCVFFVCSSLVAEAVITCGAVTQGVAPCIGYLTGSGGRPSPQCCGAIKNLNSAATSPADRKTACNCLKRQAGSIHSLNFQKASALPSLCRVRIPYQISPHTDCNSVH